MLVLGIDPGTAITGYGLVSETGGTMSLIGYGAITTTPAQALPQRLQAIYLGLQEIIQTYQPTEAAIEELFFSKNARTALSVGHGRGVAMLALAEANLGITEYKPAEIKQAITGYGQADKRQIQEMVKLLLDLDDIIQPDDAADAVAIAICHIQASRYYELVNR